MDKNIVFDNEPKLFFEVTNKFKKKSMYAFKSLFLL